MGKVFIKGIGHQQSRGIQGGRIINRKEAEKSILSTISVAEKIAGYNIQSITINVSTSEITSSTINTNIQLGGKEVKNKNIATLLKDIRDILKKENKDIIHLMPLQYALDGNIVESPYGMEAENLRITFHLLSTTKNNLIKIKDCMKTMMLNINNYVSDGYATSLSVLEETEKELGAMILDIGHNNTNVSIVYNNKYVFEGNIGIAGENITKDISTILKVTQQTAEKIKVMNTNFSLSRKDEDELIKIQIDTDEDYEVSKNKIELINNIAKARIEEIVELSLNKLTENCLQNVPKYIVLTGGTALIPGIDLFVSRIAGLETRIGYNDGFNIQDRNLAVELKSPIYSVSMGILKFVQNKYKDGGLDMDDDSMFFSFLKKIFT
jgi:cell division protein FtsA